MVQPLRTCCFLDNKTFIDVAHCLLKILQFEVFPEQSFKQFLLTNYIPASSIILKVNGQITDDQNYFVKEGDDIDLKMIRAYQLPEYCQMLELWDKRHSISQGADSIYSNKFLWFNNSGICELKRANIQNKGW